METESDVVTEDWSRAVILPLYKERRLNVGISEVLAC